MERIYSRGFTLIDLIITLAVAAILFGVAIPAFYDLIRTNQLATQIGLFARVVNVGRSEAIKQHATTFVCARNGQACAEGADWSKGWLVYRNLDDDDQLKEEEILAAFGPLAKGYTLTPNVRTNALRFTGDGRVRRQSGALPLMTFRLCAPDANAEDVRERSRELVINATGRMRIQFGRVGKTQCP